MSDQSSTKALSFFSKMQMANLVDADVSEEDKIRVMINQSSLNLNTKFGNALPENYTCYRCGNTGHHIRNCPTSGDKNFEGPPRIKKSTGIPRSFMVEVDDPNIKGVMLTNSGRYAIPAIDAEAYAAGKKEKPPFVPQEKPKSEGEEDPVPDELLCLICHDLLGDAVVIPCCGNSYCDDCIRTALLDSEDHVCPTCSQSDVSPDALIANKFLRQAVNNFKKERGGSKSVGKSGVASSSKASTPAPAPVPTPPPVSVQSQLSKPLQSPCSQKDSLLNLPKAAKPTTVTESPDVPPEATNPAPAENSSNTSPQPVESQAVLSNNEDEEKTGDDLAAVAPFLAVSDKEPTDAPKPLEPQVEPQVNSTEETEQLQTVCVNQRNSSSDSALGLSLSSNSWERYVCVSTCSSSAPPPGGTTEPSTEQHLTTTTTSSSLSFSSYSTTPSPLFSSPPPHTFVPTQQPHSSYPPPGYPQTTPNWKLPAPRGAPIPSLCPSTCTSPIPVLIPKEWCRYQRKERERSPHRRSSSHSKSSKSKSSRSYSRSSSRSASRSRSRSRPRSPLSSRRNVHTHSNPSCSYGYKRPSSHTSSSSSRGGHSRCKSSSHHRKSSRHSRRSSPSGHGSKIRGEAGRSPFAADTGSQEVDRQRYLQWKEEYHEWYDKYYTSFINQFHQLPLPPPPPPPYSQDSSNPPQSRRPASPPSSETSSCSRSPPSRSSSDTHSTASHPSIDSCSSDKANDRDSSSSSDSRSTPSDGRAQPREIGTGTATKSGGEANSQDANTDNQQKLKDVDSSHSIHEQKKKRCEGVGAKASESLDSKSDLRQDKRGNNEPNACEEGSPGPHKAKESVQLALKTDKRPEKGRERKDKKESHLKNEQSSKSRDSESRQDMQRKDKVKPSKGPDRVGSEREEQPGGSKASDSRSEVIRKRKWEDKGRSERKSSLTVTPQSSKYPKTKSAEPQSHDGKFLKLSDRKKPKPEKKESKTVPPTPRNVWEGGMKVIPPKKISININLDGKRKDELPTQETKDQTGVAEENLNKDGAQTEAGGKKESSPRNLTKDKPVLHVVKEIPDKAAFRDDKQQESGKRDDENKEKEEDSDLWHCALTSVEDVDENLTGLEAEKGKDDCRHKQAPTSKKDEGTRRETRGEPRRDDEITARGKPKNLYDGRSSASKNDSGSSARGSCGVEGSQRKRTGMKTQEGSSQDQAEVTQVSRSRCESDGRKQAQTESVDSAARPPPSVTVTSCELTKNNEQQRQRSTERKRDRDRVADRDKEKERRSAASHSAVAPSGGGERTDGSVSTKRDEETKPERPQDRESESQKERRRLKQGSREEASVQKRSHPSSSSVLHEKERRDRPRGSEQGSSDPSFSGPTWKAFRESRYPPDPNAPWTHRDAAPDLMSKKDGYHFHSNYQQRSSASSREKNRPDRTHHSPPPFSGNHSEDKDLLLLDSTENSQKGFPDGGLTQNKSRTESKPQKGEKSEKTPKMLKDCKRGRETPEVGDSRGGGGGGGAGSRREDQARKLEERRRSSSDSVRLSSSSHKTDRDDKREEGKEKKHRKLQEVNV
ncbi:E3 ubiquitin-protein ligase RBBP6 isoform X3 [Kryptolebias marmoratus]|nr:E3 ubiquitin-protein ligase RBBP6 isoform X3 [Kryptolebias marmoratus]XP_037834716.1 E3 ubiquitin-protein ligase RBBP6 isoform X3 [Kryptolebias marmoratus]XP_037834717.1 E3 ubiquitin-protein ligase RBBP6 isoform X3 [Kryptolebias marmoratus]